MTPEIAAALGALATSGVLAASKALDSKVTSAPLFRKLQPAFTLAGAVFGTFLTGHGVTDPATLTTAPIATLGTVVMAELLSLLRKKL